LLKKPDQCRAVYLASHLWWAVPITAKGEAEDEKDVSLKSLGFMSLANIPSCIVMVSEFSSVSNVLFESQILAWTRPFQLNSLLRF